ncbi:MAG: Rnase Y domain-containing protein, partial [Fuerstiella sp.]
MDYIVPAIAGGVGLAIGFFVDRIIKGRAYRTGDEIVAQAKREAENQVRDQEIALKEEMLKRREKLEQKLEESRDGLRERERKIDKRDGQL